MLDPADTLADEKGHKKDSPRSRPSSSLVREVSGEEALLAHIQESARERSVVGEAQPTLLGERSIGDSRSIAQVMHTPASPQSSINLEEGASSTKTGGTISSVNGLPSNHSDSPGLS